MTEFIQFLWDFISSGIYDLITAAFAQFVIWATVSAIEFKIFILKFSWDIASQILENIGIIDLLVQQAGFLSEEHRAILSWLNFWDGLNLIINAGVTRYVMSFMGFK